MPIAIIGCCDDQPAHLGFSKIWFIYPSIPFVLFLSKSRRSKRQCCSGH